MGPYENYQDMCHHTTIGKFTSTPSKEYVPYIKPQHHGNHTKTKWLEIDGLRFSADRAFEFNVSNYAADMLTYTAHADELIENEHTIVRIDYKNSGIGSNSCGPELLNQYRPGEKTISFGFSLNPIG